MNNHIGVIMIIKQLSKISFDRVIKHDYIDNALALELHASKLNDLATVTLVNANNEAADIKIQAYNNTTDQLVIENNQLLHDIEDKLDTLLSNIGNDLYDIVYRVLNKLGIDNIGAGQIKNLLKNEFDNFSHIKKLKISANNMVITQLKNEFNIIDTICEWETNVNLGDLECMVTTHLWSLRLDLSTTRNKIEQILCNNKLQEHINDSIN